ncbi:hypothetical protein EDD11_010016 [Mortierella claussenii]|nr:hypothetical protein EDD11_010016 [Mortierella claussenii]
MSEAKKGKKAKSKPTATVTSSQTDKYARFLSVFRDPPDASSLQKSITFKTRDQLEQRVEEPTVVAENDAENGASNPKTFRGLQENATGEHQRNIFLATQYLLARIQEMVYGDQDKEPFTLAREGKSFKTIAQELGVIEPSLKGVTGLALHAMYMRLIKDYEELKKVLVVETGGRFQPTLLTDLVKDLYNMDRELKKTKRQRIEEKADQRQREATLLAVRNEEAISTALQRFSKKPRVKRNATARVTSPVPQSSAAQSAPPSTIEVAPLSSTESASSTGPVPSTSAHSTQSISVRSVPSTSSRSSRSVPLAPGLSPAAIETLAQLRSNEDDIRQSLSRAMDASTV